MDKRNRINRNKLKIHQGDVWGHMYSWRNKISLKKHKKVLLLAMVASSLLFADGLYTTYVYADGGQQFHGISVNVEGAGGVSGNNYNNDGAGYWSVAIGIGASSQAGYGTAVGPNAKADALGSNATGFYAQALGQYSAAYGAGAKAINAFGVAFGQGAVVSFGKPLKEAEYNTLPESYKKLFTAVKTETAETVYYQTKILLQNGSIQDKSVLSVAIGASAAATDSNAVAIGFKSSADVMGSLSIGAYSEAKGKQGLALGYVAKAIGDFSTAVGQWSQANGDHAVAIGYGAITEKNKAGVAIGYESHSMRAGGKGWNPITDQVWDDSDALIKEQIKALDEEIARKQALEQQAKEELAKFPNDPDLIEKARVAHNEKAKAEEKKNKLFATWKTPTGDVAVGNIDTGMTRQITGVAAGSEDTDAVNVAQLKALNRKNVTQLDALNSKVDTFDTKIETVKKIVEDNKIHYFSVGPDNEKNYYQVGENYKNDGVEQHGGIAIGFDASSKDGDGIAVGKSAQARGWESTGIGALTYSVGDFSTAMGTRAQAFGESASAYGSLARAYGANGVAIGTGSLVASKKAITKAAFDALPEEQKSWYNTDKVKQKELYQYREKDKNGDIKDIETNGTAVGNYASSIGISGVAVGDHAKSSDIDNVNGSDFGVAIGAYSQNKVAQGVALGASSVSDRAENILGYLPNKNGIIENLEEAMEAVGKGKEFTDLKNEYTQAQAEMNAAKVASDGNPGNPDLKMKYEQEKQKFDALTNKYAIMTAPWTSRKGAVSIGNDKKGQTRQLIGVAAGSEDTDAVNVAQLKALNDKVDKGSIHYFSVNSGKPAKLDGTNWSNDGAIGEDAVAIGNRAKAQGKSSTALGNAAKAEKESSTALGYRAIAKEESSTALGYSAKAQGKSSTALGYDAKAKGESSTALGNAAQAKGEFSTALGHGAIAKEESSTALGNAAQAEKEFSTALGYRAIAKGVSSMALGREAQALVDGSVALGEGTVAGRAAGKVGYVASAGDTTFDAVLTALGKKTDYDNWTATINPLKETYDNLTKAYFGAQSSREGVAAKDALDKWKGEHKEFLDALEEKSKLEATWRATKAAVSVGVDGVNKAGNRIIESRQITHVAAGSEDTDAVNVAQLKALAMLPMNMYSGGKVENNTYTPGNTNWSMPFNEFRMDFGDGLKATQVTDKDGKKYTLVTFDEESISGKADKDASNIGDAERTAWAGKLGTGKVEADNANLVTGKTVYDFVNPVKTQAETNATNITGLTTRVGKNESDIKTLQGGFTLQDANKTVGKQTVKAGSTVTVTGDTYVKATVNDKGLTLGLNEDALNSQINTQITSNSTVTGKMSAWKLKANGVDGEGTVNNTDNTVTFDAETAKGLTVTRDKNTIKYGINVDSLANNITSNVVTNINKGDTAIENISAKFSVTDGANTKAVNLGKGKNNNVKFVGEAGKIKVAVGGDNDAPTVTVTADADLGKNIDISGNTAITNINKTLKADKATVVAGDYVTVTTTPNAETGNTFTVKGPKITGEGSVNVSDIEEGGKKVGYKITGKNTTLAKGTSGLSVADGKLKLNVADTDGNAVTGEVDLKTLDLSGNETIVNIKKDITNINKIEGELSKKADKDATNIDAEAKAKWAEKLGTGSISDNDANLVSGKTVKAALDKKVDTDLSNLTETGKTQVKTLAGEQIAATVTEDFVTEKVKKGSISSTTLDVSGDGKLVNADLKIDIKDGGVTKAKLSEDLKKEIEGKADKTYVDSELAKKATTEALTEGLAKKVDQTTYDTAMANKADTATVKKQMETVMAEAKKHAVVSAGANISVTEMTQENGGKIFTVAAKDMRVKSGVVTYDDVGTGSMILTHQDGTTATVTGLKDTYTKSGYYDADQKSLIFTRNDGQKYDVDMSRLINGIDTGMNRLAGKMNGIAASNAALAGLHPLEYDEDDKWNLSAAIGNYKGANAFALGAFYRPNERTLLSIGGTLAGEEHLLNVGLSLKTGPGTAGKVYVSRAAMAREIQALKLQNKQREAESQKLLQDNRAIREENKEMKKELEWLKAQVAQLMAK